MCFWTKWPKSDESKVSVEKVPHCQIGVEILKKLTFKGQGRWESHFNIMQEAYSFNLTTYKTKQDRVVLGIYMPFYMRCVIFHYDIVIFQSDLSLNPSQHFNLYWIHRRFLICSRDNPCRNRTGLPKHLKMIIAISCPSVFRRHNILILIFLS